MSEDLINIERELVRLSSALDQLTDEFQGLCFNAADARCTYDQEWAKALLRADDGTQKVKEAEATRACEKYMREARVSEAIRDAAKERIRALQTVISVHQSRLRYIDESKRTF